MLNYKYILYILPLVFTGMAFNSTQGIPEWKDRPTDVNATVGEDVRINCSLTGLNQNHPAKPRWDLIRNGGQPDGISGGGVIYDLICCELIGDWSKGENHLLIKNITHNYEGVWKCSHVLARPQTINATVLVKDADDGEASTGSQPAKFPIMMIIVLIITIIFVLAG